MTERDLNYVEDSAELFYERNGERCEITSRGCRIRYPGSAVGQPREKATPTPRTQNRTICAHSRQ